MIQDSFFLIFFMCTQLDMYHIMNLRSLSWLSICFNLITGEGQASWGGRESSKLKRAKATGEHYEFRGSTYEPSSVTDSDKVHRTLKCYYYNLDLVLMLLLLKKFSFLGHSIRYNPDLNKLVT